MAGSKALTTLETIADIGRIPGMLAKKGVYSKEDIQLVMHGNWLRFPSKKHGRIRKFNKEMNKIKQKKKNILNG